MLELVGSEDKDTKVKVRVINSNDFDNINICYDGFLVAYIHRPSGQIRSMILWEDEEHKLKAKGVKVESNHRIRIS